MHELSAIRRLLTSSRTSVRFSKTWEALCDETGVGTRVGQLIHFTPDDRERLREYAQAEFGVDPQFEDRRLDRMGMAMRDASEKLSSQSVFGHLLLVATTGTAKVRVGGVDSATPPGAFLTVEPDALDRDELRSRHLIIIENGAVLSHAQKIGLPVPWADSVCLYRGHGDNVREVDAIVAAQPPERLGFFMDFDPAGLALGLASGKGTLLVPADWKKLDYQTSYNQPKVHHDQVALLDRSLASPSSTIQSLAQHLKQERLALMQEHLVSRGLPLMAIPIQ